MKDLPTNDEPQGARAKIGVFYCRASDETNFPVSGEVSQIAGSTYLQVRAEFSVVKEEVGHEEVESVSLRCRFSAPRWGKVTSSSGNFPELREEPDRFALKDD